MRDFERLTRVGQARRRTALARVAVQRWPLRVRRLVHLGTWENATWRVQADEGVFLLRIHRAGYHSEAGVRAELAWLEDLRARSGWPMQRPVTGIDGDCVQSVEVPGLARRCTLLTWIDGRMLRKGLRPSHARQFGAMMATLHDLDGPSTLDRPTWERDWMAPGRTGVPEVDGLLSPRTWARFDAASERLLEATAGLPRGLIHCDLHPWNVIWTGGQPIPIDFDDCLYGPHIVDIATAWCRLEGAVAAGFLEGYRSRRPFEHEALLPEVVALEGAGVARWLASRLHTRVVRDRAPAILERIRGDIEGFQSQRA